MAGRESPEEINGSYGDKRHKSRLQSRIIIIYYPLWVLFVLLSKMVWQLLTLSRSLTRAHSARWHFNSSAKVSRIISQDLLSVADCVLGLWGRRKHLSNYQALLPFGQSAPQKQRITSYVA